MPTRGFQSPDSIATSQRLRRGKSTPGTKNFSTVSRKGNTRYLSVGGTPTLSRPSSRRRAVRQADRVRASLGRVRKAYQSPSGVTGDFTPGEKTFINRVARKTGLSPRVVGAQSKLEGGADQDYNLLNIARTDSGSLASTEKPVWEKPKSAADETVAVFKGKRPASEGIRAIVPTSAGKSDEKQIKTIARSGWATDPAYESKLRSVHATIGEKKPKPPAKKDVKVLRRAGVDPSKDVKVTTGEAPAKPLPPKLISRFQAAKKAARGIEKEQMPYQWGGGHVEGTIPKGQPLDCSAAVRAVLQRAGYETPPMVASDFKNYGKPGPGALTIYAKDDHVLMRVGNKFFGTSGSNPDGGAGWIEAEDIDSGYLSAFTARHVPGMGKQVAADLGVKIAKAGGATGIGTPPGATGGDLSASGGTGKGGTSVRKKKGATRKQKLRRVQAAFSGTSADSGTTTDAELESLAKRYGSPVV